MNNIKLCETKYIKKILNNSTIKCEYFCNDNKCNLLNCLNKIDYIHQINIYNIIQDINENQTYYQPYKYDGYLIYHGYNKEVYLKNNNTKDNGIIGIIDIVSKK